MPQNVHVNIADKNTGYRPYHQVVARLVAKYGDPSLPLLDVGTGAGNIPRLVHSLGFQSIDVADAYKECLQSTAESVPIRQSYLIDENTFNISDVIPPSSYNVVTMSHVLEHLLNPVKGLQDVYDLIAPGGVMVLAVPNPMRPIGVIQAIRRKRYSNLGHVVTWDRSHWMNFLERIMAYEVAEYASDSVPILPRSSGRFERAEIKLARVLPWLSFTNIAVIRKPLHPH
ncbi:class I SAM-dependent methyltransferase [Mycobacterium sp. IDR2000157661]|uniref:class I SAM-dependent methyltransferase n=1 Tax=Mycobacterium sp. IDR2000157661 TaxID=2867005 RepID=UPI00351D3E81|nr:class I SAM-dependent methyltransferase [Mycobacterium sp. IDR2000157661]